jgi:hypothetical protein
LRGYCTTTSLPIENAANVRFKVKGAKVDNAVEFFRALPKLRIVNGVFFRHYAGEVSALNVGRQ